MKLNYIIKMNKQKLTKIIGVMTFVVLAGATLVSARTLTVGSRGADVAELQTWLIDNGFPIPLIENGVASKGYFGEQTQTAVKIYQEDSGMALTGSIDSAGYGNEPSAPILGALAGPDLPYQYIGVGGVRTYSFQTNSLTQASSTLCSIQSPAATSTLVGAAIRFDLASTSVAYIDTYKVSTIGAASSTGTQLGTNYTIAAGAQATIVASTTGSTWDANGVFAPSQIIRWAIQSYAGGANPGLGNAPSGSCQASFRVI